LKVSTFTLEINFRKPYTMLHHKISQNRACSKLWNRISKFISFESCLLTLEIFLQKELININFEINFEIIFQCERGLNWRCTHYCSVLCTVADAIQATHYFRRTARRTSYTQIAGDLMVEQWQLVDIPTYGCCIVLAGIAIIRHTTSFLLMKYVHCPQTVWVRTMRQPQRECATSRFIPRNRCCIYSPRGLLVNQKWGRW